MPKKTKISEEDAHLFRQAVKRVRPLHHDMAAPQPARPKPIPKQRIIDERKVRDDLLSDAYDPAELETGDELLFARPGLQHTVLRKLRRGQFSVTAELDLHGMTVAQARLALSEFLHHCRNRRARCVRVIHGKGHGSHHKIPILKGKVSGWLRQRDEVLAFCSACRTDGGGGAVYVLLKRC